MLRLFHRPQHGFCLAKQVGNTYIYYDYKSKTWRSSAVGCWAKRLTQLLRNYNKQHPEENLKSQGSIDLHLTELD